MRPERMTNLALQVMQQAQTNAAARSNPEVVGLYVLEAILDDATGPGASILKGAGVEPGRLARPRSKECATWI